MEDEVAERVIDRWKLKDKALLTAGADMVSTHSLPGIAPIRMADGPMGVASTRVDERDIAYLTPCGTALGATWDIDLVERIGALVGSDARRLCISMMLAPNLNLIRSPLAGRSFEIYSEDPFIAGSMGVAWLNGLRIKGVGSVAKHLVCNDSETHRDTMNSVVDERALREVYLLPFEMAARAGCAGLMTAYNRVNGEYCSQHFNLITTVVKQEWGFKGFLVSDWFGTHDTVLTANAGLDLEMPGPARHLGQKFGAAVEIGEIPHHRLDDAVKRIAAAAGDFPAVPPEDLTDAAADRDLLTEAAAAGFVLLKNQDGSLPIPPGSVRRLAVIGPNAVDPCYQGGTFAKIGLTPAAVSPLDAIRTAYGSTCQIVFEPGVRPAYRLPPMPVRPVRHLGDGERGVTVEFFGSHDFAQPPLAAETRNTNSLTWFGTMPGVGSIATEAGVRACGIFMPPEDGPYSFFAGGTGDIRLLIDGRELINERNFIAGGDVMGPLKAGNAHRVDVELQAGTPVRVEVELRYRPARAQGLWFGIDSATDVEEMIHRAEVAAREADAVILVLGETSDAGVESRDRTDTLLPADQLRLIDKVARANDRVALIANVGHAFDAAWIDQVQALLVAWYPGQEFGPALADVLTGRREPGGRLPSTFARHEGDYEIFRLTPDERDDLHYSESWRIGYRSFAERRVEPRFALGEGRGYAEFELSDCHIQREPAGYAVSVKVKNLSLRAGKEVLQLYLSAPDSPQVPLLKGFRALTLKPGEERRVSMQLEPRDFAFWDPARSEWVTATGKRTILLGRSLRHIDFELEVQP
jgi:beta-glucosidase